jgi:GT2 family glycosyltransferase
MGMLGNRLRTITGENAGIIESVSRLFYYTFGTRKWIKVFGKIKQWTSAGSGYADLLKAEKEELTDAQIAERVHHFSALPIITVVVLGDDTERTRQTLASLEAQIFKGFQLFVVHHYAPSGFTVRQVSQFPEDGFSFFVNAGDMLDKRCLFYLMQTLQETATPRLVYTNQDQINGSGERFAPLFKPGWSPDVFAERNYIQQALIETKLVAGIDLKNKEASQVVKDVLQNEQLQRPDIIHIDKVLLSEQEPLSLNTNVVSGQTNIVADELVSIIIPTKNRTDLVEQCIQSIIALSTYKKYEIILVDNRSDDPAFFAFVENLKNAPDILFTCVTADIEFNFSALINLGVAQSKGSYILLLNNDVKVITPDWLELLLFKARQAHVGAIGVKLLYPNETIQHAGIVLSAEKISEHVFVGEKPHAEVYQNALNTTRNYLAITAACLMVSRNKFDEVGGFDEQFVVEYNDIDFCLKLYQAGYYNVYLPKVLLFHYESASRRHPHSDKKSYQRHLAETEMMKRKWPFYISHDPFFIFKHLNCI